MNRTETLALTRYVQALCPAQKLDQYSADAWHDVLGDLPIGVAKKAAAMCARLKPFVAPSEIVGAAWRLRRAVSAQVARETEDTDAPQDGAGYVAWRRRRLREVMAEVDRRIGDNVYDLSRVDIAGDVYVESEPVVLERVDGRPAIEARRVDDEPTVPLAEVLARAREIREASRTVAPDEPHDATPETIRAARATAFTNRQEA